MFIHVGERRGLGLTGYSHGPSNCGQGGRVNPIPARPIPLAPVHPTSTPSAPAPARSTFAGVPEKDKMWSGEIQQDGTANLNPLSPAPGPLCQLTGSRKEAENTSLPKIWGEIGKRAKQIPQGFCKRAYRKEKYIGQQSVQELCVEEQIITFPSNFLCNQMNLFVRQE